LRCYIVISASDSLEELETKVAPCLLVVLAFGALVQSWENVSERPRGRDYGGSKYGCSVSSMGYYILLESVLSL
jgi:hypothetical protein